MNARLPFDSELFSRLRAARELAWGEPLTYQLETGSTNDDALVAARAGAPHGSLFLAEFQTRGRGRRGRNWHAESGQGLLFSLLLRPGEGQGLNPALTLSVGLGLRAALAPYSAEPLGLKWPNDVVSAEHKLAGILCEGHFEGSRAEALVIGIGVNLAERDFPQALRDSATSLSLLVGSDTALPPREQLLVDILAAVAARLETCLRHGFAALLEEFRSCDALYGQAISVDGVGLQGVARGVDSEGRLLVESEGQVIAAHAGTVRRLQKSQVA